MIDDIFLFYENMRVTACFRVVRVGVTIFTKTKLGKALEQIESGRCWSDRWAITTRDENEKWTRDTHSI